MVCYVWWWCLTEPCAAPEQAFDRRIDFPGDMFSFGCLIHALYYEGAPPLRAGRSTSAHRSAFDAIEGKSFEQIPVGLRGEYALLRLGRGNKWTNVPVLLVLRCTRASDGAPDAAYAVRNQAVGCLVPAMCLFR